MKIIDTFIDIHKCYLNNRFELENWIKYADSISPTLADKLLNDIEGYDFQKDVLPILNEVPCNIDKVNLAHQSFLSLTNGLVERISCDLNSNIDVDIIFYLGLCNGAGWATTLDDKPVVLLGVEKIIELSWYDKTDLAGLLYHELGHIWHDQTRSGTCSRFKNDSLWQLYREGIAMYVEQLLLNDLNFYHQDNDGWLLWCDSNKTELLNEFSTRIKNQKATIDFFGDWNNYKGKSDTGYFLGCELIKVLAEKYSMIELANIDEELFYTELCNITVDGNNKIVLIDN